MSRPSMRTTVRFRGPFVGAFASTSPITGGSRGEVVPSRTSLTLLLFLSLCVVVGCCYSCHCVVGVQGLSSLPRFDCQHDFDTWFTIHKAATHTSFAKDQGYESSEGYNTTLRCTRSARRGEVAADPVIRPLRGKPTIKLEAACTCAVRTCKHFDGSVRAEIIGLHTHWRSATELRNSRLSPETNSFVASMLAIGLGDKAIMRLVQADIFNWERRDDCDTAVSRDSLLSTQDIRNIRRLNSPQLHSCDTTSFDMMVRALILEENSPILYYKSPGEPGRDGLDEDDWCLVISTVWMQDQLAHNVSLSLFSVSLPLFLSRSCLSLTLTHSTPCIHSSTATCAHSFPLFFIGAPCSFGRWHTRPVG
jgi:hypothetical protein